MRMTKKITSLALAVMLVVSMLVVGAVSASAAGTITDAQSFYNACRDGGEYTLANDITLAGYSDYLVENDIDIDGNGKTLTASDDVASIFCWHNNANAKVTLKDAKLDGNNTAENAVYTPAYGLSNAQQNQNSDALVKFTNVEVCNFKGFQYVGAVYLFSHSKGEFTNCNFHDNSTPELDEDGFHGSDIWGGAATTNTISGGTFSDSVFVNGAVLLTSQLRTTLRLLL